VALIADKRESLHLFEAKTVLAGIDRRLRDVFVVVL
jgi:hypothetical protein